MVEDKLYTPESHYVPFVKIESNPHWDLMFEPKDDVRYDPRQFHIGMFNEWTNKVCTEHRHKLKKS
jgi:hypothetical protein